MRDLPGIWQAWHDFYVDWTHFFFVGVPNVVNGTFCLTLYRIVFHSSEQPLVGEVRISRWGRSLFLPKISCGFPANGQVAMVSAFVSGMTL